MSGKKFSRGGSVDSCTDYLSEKVKMAFVEVAAHENVHQVWPLNQYFGLL